MVTPSPIRRRSRQGALLAEVGIALVVLAIAAALVAQFTIWSLDERARIDARLEAIDLAANILERAQAESWDHLTTTWAAGQKLPDTLTKRWPECRLTVRVEPEKDRPRVKRVTVEVKWEGEMAKTRPPVTLTGLFAARTAGGGK